ncbi:MAG: lyase, partial [Nitrosopumilus sp.]|nr:lyase [Nitrosopumilus sp.]
MNKKGLIVVLFFGGIMVSSGFGLQNMMTPPEQDATDLTLTGTPADNFPEEQRAQFCGSSNAKSTNYVKEFSIPTLCTNPLAVVTDYSGDVWFTQTNTGKLAKFDPITETFTEYDNPLWPSGGRSMMWGLDYAPDGNIWYTDESYDSIWKFSTLDEKYERLAYPSEGNSLPQKLRIDGSQIIINDFTGNKLTFLDPNQSGDDVNYLSIPSPVDESVTADFAIDADDNIWYTNWLFQQGGILVKFNQNGYLDSVANSGEKFLPLLDFIEIYPLPLELLTPNGAVVGNDGTVWLADTTSSSFFNFDPLTEQFIQYVTADPLLSTYGNQTGIVKTPISRPYWVESDDQGRIVFNEQTANNISVMDPKSQSLVEYHVPSKNP